MPLFGSSQGPETQDRPAGQPIVPVTNQQPQKQPATIIAKGVRLEGDFKSHGDVQIEGEVIGTVQTDNLLTIGKEAQVKAMITASEAIIAGKVDGNITVTKKLECKSTAQIKGDLKCATITVEIGAILSGQVECGKATADDKQNKTEAPRQG